jgi:hypothetical protein
MNLGYIDPGSGSMILQMILGGLAAAAVFLKLFWHRLLVFLRIRKPSEPSTSTTPGRSESFEQAADRSEGLERTGEPVAKN